MSLILNIDTSTENASISLAENDNCLCLLSNNSRKDHASWLHLAVQQAFSSTGKRLEELQAVGMTAGPGSYTGLRIGMAAAKGLCFTLQIPIIPINTLEAMASAGIHEEADYVCPMVDARRQEVFTGLYDKQLTTVLEPCAMILTKDSFSSWLHGNRLVIFGSGAQKFSQLLDHPNAVFREVHFNSSHLIPLVYKRFTMGQFADLTYLEPFYLKEFQGSLGNL